VSRRRVWDAKTRFRLGRPVRRTTHTFGASVTSRFPTATWTRRRLKTRPLGTRALGGCPYAQLTSNPRNLTFARAHGNIPDDREVEARSGQVAVGWYSWTYSLRRPGRS
jgi:hypothetical protein